MYLIIAVGMRSLITYFHVTFVHTNLHHHGYVHVKAKNSGSLKGSLAVELIDNHINIDMDRRTVQQSTNI